MNFEAKVAVDDEKSFVDDGFATAWFQDVAGTIKGRLWSDAPDSVRAEADVHGAGRITAEVRDSSIVQAPGGGGRSDPWPWRPWYWSPRAPPQRRGLNVPKGPPKGCKHQGRSAGKATSVPTRQALFEAESTAARWVGMVADAGGRPRVDSRTDLEDDGASGELFSVRPGRFDRDGRSRPGVPFVASPRSGTTAKSRGESEKQCPRGSHGKLPTHFLFPPPGRAISSTWT